MSSSPDLAHALPLSSRRALGRSLLAAPFVLVAAGIVGVAAAGRESAWAGLLSAGLPGLGQLVQGRWIAGAIFLLLTLVALAYWQLRSGSWLFVFLVPVAAIDAAVNGAWWGVLAGLGVGAVLAVTINRSNAALRRNRERRLAAARAAAPAPETGASPAHVQPAESAPAPPAGPHEEAHLRFLLRFGHAAPDDWSVFDDPKHMDSALRYQMVLSAWSLYLTQNRLTPAYREAYSVCMGNFAERCRDQRVWDYTSKLMLKALKIEHDPFAYENVMYSGYANEVIGMYEAMSGDHRYDEPGGYTVHDDKRTFEWSHPEIVDRLVEQFGTDPYGQISCTPGWIWPPCQGITLRGILLADQVHGTDHGWVLDRFADGFRKAFVGRRGQMITMKSNLGIQQVLEPMLLIPTQAGTATFLSAIDPSLVEGHYERYVKTRMEPPDENGRIHLKLRPLDQYDTSYGTNAGFPYSLCLLYASEVGDTETAAGLRLTLEDMLTPDEQRPGPGSILSLAFLLASLVNGKGGMYAAVRQVPAHATTPELGSAPYPQVIVTGARYENGQLTCTLAPGPEADGQVELRVDRLEAGRTYRVNGSREPTQMEADPQGSLRVKVESNARQQVTVSPSR